jgi:small Trp-rich protein
MAYCQENAMPLIIIIVVVTAMKLLEVWKFAELSWWWIAGLMGLAFVWFEFVEKIFGLDKRKQHNVDAARRKKRVQESFAKKK